MENSSRTNKALPTFPETTTPASATEWVQYSIQSFIDPEYQEFQSKLIPTIDPDFILGVRMPDLRRIAKTLVRNPELTSAFFKAIPHTSYEENNIHGLAINESKTFDETIRLLEAFLPEVDNWATCDLLSPKAFKKVAESSESPILLKQVDQWITSTHLYTIRFGVGVLMQNYLGDAFEKNVLKRVVAIQSEEYYVNMMRAWFFAEALTKQKDATLPILEQHHLDTWTHNKSIQKAIESRRISPELKDYVRSLKVKG